VAAVLGGQPGRAAEAPRSGMGAGLAADMAVNVDVVLDLATGVGGGGKLRIKLMVGSGGTGERAPAIVLVDSLSLLNLSEEIGTMNEIFPNDRADVPGLRNVILFPPDRATGDPCCPLPACPSLIGAA
jgi:hypothetical protein